MDEKKRRQPLTAWYKDKLYWLMIGVAIIVVLTSMAFF